MNSKSVYIIDDKKRRKEALTGLLIFCIGVGISALGLARTSLSSSCSERYVGEFIDWIPEEEEENDNDGN